MTSPPRPPMSAALIDHSLFLSAILGVPVTVYQIGPDRWAFPADQPGNKP